MINIPERYRALLAPSGVVTLSVLGIDRSIQSTLVWTDFDGECVKLNMLRDSPKEQNIRREGKATVLAIDKENEDFYVSVRCKLQEISAEGAVEHLNMLTQRNMGVSKWYGEVEPIDPEAESRRVIVFLRPIRVYHT